MDLWRNGMRTIAQRVKQLEQANYMKSHINDKAAY